MSLDIGLLNNRRVRLVRQTEIAECGLAAVAMIANFHGMDVDLGTLRRRFQTSLRGAALKSLMVTADSLGLSSRAVKVPLGKIGGLHLPAILHWNMNHYVVLERVSRSGVLIHDPEGISQWVSLEDLSRSFTGVALELRPTSDFEPVKQRTRIKLSQLWQKITGLKRALVQTVILSIVLQVFVLASPYYLQVAIDSALPALDRDLISVLALGFGLFTLINAAASLLRSFVLLSAGTALGYGIAINVARRLFRLPVSWFERRHIGDILSRFQSVIPIRQLLTEGAVSALLDGSLATLTLILMFFYSPLLALIAFVSFAAYVALRIGSYPAQQNAQERVIMAMGREQSIMIESLRGIVTLRLFNREAARHALWQTRLTDASNAGIASSRIEIWQQSTSTLIFGLETVITVWLAIRLVMTGGFSVGMIFAYIALKTQFIQRATSLVDQVAAFRMLDLHLERISDIALADQDSSFSVERIIVDEFSGKMELKDITFRYTETESPVLNKLNLVIEAGEHVAITGASGGGKSTLVKIITGLIEPESGTVLVDDKEMTHYGCKGFREQLGVVLQNDNVFAGSLIDNIALSDDVPDMNRVQWSAGLAALHEDISDMPMGYETLVGDMGSTLSGGQKQRLLLARALYKRPKILVMDEGTSHLDPALERQVNAAIERLGITRIVIAHRLETVLSAQKVYKLIDGKVEEVTQEFSSMREWINNDLYDEARST